jgi:hypothetical protein
MPAPHRAAPISPLHLGRPALPETSQ